MTPKTESRLEQGSEHSLVVPHTPRVRGWRRILGILNRLYRWAESGWAVPAVFTWSLGQGSVVPGPADAMLIPLGLADPRRAYRLALVATIGSVLGALIGWYIGGHFDGLAPEVLRWVGMTEPSILRVQDYVQDHGWLVVAGSAIFPVSTKAVCITAGALGMPLPEFLLGIGSGRLLRFFFIATVLRFAGSRFRTWLQRKAGTANRVASA